MNNKNFFGSKIFFNMFITYFAAFIIPVIAACIIGIVIARDVARKDIHGECTRVIEATAARIDDAFWSLGSFAVMLSHNSWVNSMMSAPPNNITSRVTPVEVLNHLNEIKIMNAMNAYADQMAVFFSKQNIMITSLGKDTLEDFFGSTFVYESLSVEDWRAILAENNRMTILPFSPATIFRNEKKNYMSLIQSFPMGNPKHRGAILFFISEERFKRYFDLLEASGHIDYFVKDAQGDILYSSRDAALQAASEAIGDYEVYHASSKVLGLMVTMYTPMSLLPERMKIFLLYTSLIILVCTFVGVFFSYLITRRSFMPVFNIAESIRQERLEDAYNFKGEYMLIYNSLRQMISEASTLKSKMEMYRQLAVNRCLESLIRREIRSEEDALNLLRLVGIIFVMPEFCCAVINQQVDLAEIGRLTSLCEEELTAHFCFMGAVIVVVMNYSRALGRQGAAECVSAYMGGACSTSWLMGVGGVYGHVSEIHRSFLEAQVALNEGILQHDNITICFFNQPVNELGSIRYNFNDEERLINTLRAADASGATRQAHELIDRNVDVLMRSPVTAKSMFYSLSMLPLRVRGGVGDEKLDTLTDFTDFHDINAIKACIADIYSQECAKIREVIYESESLMAERIVEFTTKNFHRSEMSLTFISEHFNISISHISRLFKKATDENYSDFVNRMRVEYAKELFVHDMSIAQVIQMCGFTNDMTFRRVFKKTVGLTPGMYQKILKNKGRES